MGDAVCGRAEGPVEDETVDVIEAQSVVADGEVLHHPEVGCGLRELGQDEEKDDGDEKDCESALLRLPSCRDARVLRVLLGRNWVRYGCRR